MKKIAVVLAVVALLSGCGWGSLMGEELTGGHSVLSESLSSVGVCYS